MRAIVLSDSHNDVSSCERAILSQGKLDMIIHLGDVARDVDYLETVYYPTRVVSVLGNNDFLRTGDYERVIDFDSHKIFICHGHTLGVNTGFERLIATARRLGCEGALFGHTHRSYYEKIDNNLFILNPGSVSSPRAGNPSFAVLETDKSIKSVIVDWVL